MLLYHDSVRANYVSCLCGDKKMNKNVSTVHTESQQTSFRTQNIKPWLSKANDYGVKDRSSSPKKSTVYLPLYCAQTCSGFHPVFYPMVTVRCVREFATYKSRTALRGQRRSEANAGGTAVLGTKHRLKVSEHNIWS